MVQQLLLVIHLMLAVTLVAVILLQKSEGGGLGVGGGGGGGGMGGLMTGRSAANLLTRTTAILAAGFLATSLILAVIAAHRTAPRSLLDNPLPAGQVPVSAPAQPGQPATPPAGQVPTGQAPTGQVPTGQGQAPAAGTQPAAPATGTQPAAPAGGATAPAQPQVPVGQ